MRKLSALLLLVPVTILFVGAVNLSSYCTLSANKAGVKVEQPACCSGEDHCTRPADACQKDKDHSGSKDSKDGRTCCFDCPLCALVTANPFFRWDAVQPVTMLEYAVMSDNPLSDYVGQHWKPPGFSTFS
jgi:hypothetical protein